MHPPATLAALEFASPAMLGWLAAASIPWLVNLWSRRRHIETPWAAVELLMAAVRERSRRIRLRELLLLALRSSILLLLAFAAARPLWRSPSLAALELAARTHHVLIVDQSFSMAASIADGDRLDAATVRARQLIDNAPAGDAFTVIAWSETADNVLGRATFDPAAALAAVESIDIAETVADLNAAVRAADAAIASAAREFPGLSQTRCTFFTDLAMNTWSSALTKAAEPNASTPWTALQSRAIVAVSQVDDVARTNFAITEIAIDPPAPVLNQPATVTVAARAFGPAASTPANVELLLDGNSIGQQPATLTSDGASLRFDIPALAAGRHVFEALIAVDDALVLDNRRWLALEVTAAPRVLCIAERDAGAADIARALNPRYRRAAADPRAPQGIQVEIATPASLATAELAAYDAVFLANVATLSPREERLLDRYIFSGGAAAIVLGDHTQPAAYNKFLNVEIAAQSATGDFRLDPLDYHHPILAPFAGRNRAGLLGVRVSQYYPVELGGSEERSDAHPFAPVLAYSMGDPAILVADRGAGRIALLTTDPATATRPQPWSTLAISPSFVPLVRELFAHLATDRRGGDLNRLVGQPLTLPRAASQLPPQQLCWKDPAGHASTTAPQSQRSGVYILEVPDAPPIPIAVNVDARESDLAALDAADFTTSGGPNASSASSGRMAIADTSATVPLHSYALALAAALVLIELTVAWLFGKGWA